LPRAGIVRLSDSDFAFLYGGHEYAKRAEALFAADTKLFIVTRGIRGAQAWHKRAGAIEVETPQVEVAKQDFWSLCAPWAGSRRGRSPK
jgi:fructokinase